MGRPVLFVTVILKNFISFPSHNALYFIHRPYNSFPDFEGRDFFSFSPPTGREKTPVARSPAVATSLSRSHPLSSGPFYSSIIRSIVAKCENVEPSRKFCSIGVTVHAFQFRKFAELASQLPGTVLNSQKVWFRGTLLRSVGFY